MSFYLRCVSENASHLMNGIEFDDHPEGGVVSKLPVSADVAEPYSTIPGWQLIEVDPAIAAEIAAADEAARAARAKLLAPRPAPTPAAAAVPAVETTAPAAAPAPATPAPAAAVAAAPAPAAAPITPAPAPAAGDTEF